MAATARRMRRAAMRHSAILAARASGCTCDPWLRLTSDDGLPVVKMEHDDDCPMLQHPSQFIVYIVGGCDR